MSALNNGDLAPERLLGMNLGNVKQAIIKRGLLVVLAVVFFASGYVLRLTTSKAKTTTAAASTRVITVGDGNASQSVSASGTIEPTSLVNLNFTTSGTVNQVLVNVGQNVQSGQALANLDTAPLSEVVDQAQASLSAQQAKLANDQTANAISAQITADEATITAAQDALITAQTNLGAATLTTPNAGVVSAINVSSGSSVGTSQSAAAAANPAFTIQSSNSWVVDAGVADVDISQVQLGEQVSIVPQGTTDIGYGTVSSVGLVASTAGGVATFPVTINVTGNPTGFYSGVPAEVTITTKVVSNVIVIPVLAIYGGTTSPYVRMISGSGPVKKVPISLGTPSGANISVTSGLQIGDKIEERVPRFGGLVGGRAGGSGKGVGGGGFAGGGGLGG